MNYFLVLFVFLGCFVSINSKSQTNYNKSYDWSLSPTYPDASELILSDEQKKADAICLSNIDVIHVNGPNSDFHFEIKHIRILIQSKAGVESLNKFYLPVREQNEVWGWKYDETELKARVIQTNGTTDLISKDSVFEGEFEGRLYRYFVFDNLTIGSVIEIFIKTPAAYLKYPSEFVLTQEYPTLNRIVSYHIKSKFQPVVYQPKGYEINYQEKNDEETSEKQLLFQYKSLPASKKEELSNYASSNLFLYIQPDSWDKLISRSAMYFSMNIQYGRYTYKEKESGFLRRGLKNSAELINKYFIAEDTTRLTNLRRAEFLLKTTNEKFISSLSNSAKNTAIQGIINKFHDLYTYSQSLGLKPKIIFATNGNLHATPSGFLCTNYFEFPLIYFPELDVYYSVDPNDRIGPAPARFFNTNAVCFNLNVKPKIQPFRIKEPKSDFSMDSLNVQLTFQDDGMNAQLKKVLVGNSAFDYISEINSVSGDEIREVREAEVRYHFPKSDILALRVSTEKLDSVFIAPLKMNASLECKDLMIDLDSIIIIELGSVIGNQRELSEMESAMRETEMHLRNNTHFVRELVVTIPLGYTVKNANDFTIPFVGNEMLGFQSKAKVAGNKLIVTVDEYYHKTNYSPADYVIMHRVYAASHRFCKTKLFLTK